jgi:hypothetical protein
VLAELMSPKLSVWLVLSNPVLVHPRKQIIAAKVLDPDVDGRAVPGRDGRAGWGPRGGVGRRIRIVLAA